MDLRLFEIFCTVYEEKSFSRAAERLYLAQPTISQHIKTLEDYFGVKLFNRLGRQATPTRAGELLFQSGRPILELKKATIVSMRKMIHRLEGDLVIGASTIPGEYILPGIVSRVVGRFPAVRIIERISDTAGVITAVKDGAVELGFTGAQSAEEALEFKKFASDELILIAPNNADWKRRRQITPAGLFEHPFIMREPGSGTRLAVEKHLYGLNKKLSDLRIIAEVGSTTALKEAVKANVGVALISSLAVRDEIKYGLLLSIPIRGVKRWTRDFFVVRDTRRAASPICEEFFDFVLKTLH